MVGNALALNGAVSLDNNAVTSPAQVVVPPGGILAPDSLAGVLSGEPGSQSADLSFTDASDNETEFRVYRRTGAVGGFDLIGTIVATDTVGNTAIVTFQDPMLEANKNFSYRVTAYNAADGESDHSNTVQVHTVAIAPTGRPSGARSVLAIPVDGPDLNATGRLNVKHFPAHHARVERTWFKLKLRHLDKDTDYTLWADDPSTEGTELVQFDTFTTKHSGSYNYSRDTKKGAALTFGAALTDLGGNAIEVRNAAGTVVILSGIIPSTNP